tara:strand:+ start:97 stop:375 length:279 start_codon:yes stop_codon:yes gene_type:complete
MDIPDIQIKGGDIDIIQIPFTPDYLLEPPQALQIPVPVTTQIGVPVVDIPGCVEAHEVDENNMLEQTIQRASRYIVMVSNHRSIQLITIQMI